MDFEKILPAFRDDARILVWISVKYLPGMYAFFAEERREVEDAYRIG